MTNEADFTMDMSGGDTEGTPSDAKKSEPQTGETVLNRLRTIVEKEVRRPDIQIDIPDREGVAVVFSPNVEQEDLVKWRKQAGEGTKAGINFLKFAANVVGATTVQILVDGDPVQDDVGNDLTFGNSEILDMVDEDRPWPGIKRFWGNDAHLQATALKILDEAGWGDEAEAVNPTKG